MEMPSLAFLTACPMAMARDLRDVAMDRPEESSAALLILRPVLILSRDLFSPALASATPWVAFWAIVLELILIGRLH